MKLLICSLDFNCKECTLTFPLFAQYAKKVNAYFRPIDSYLISINQEKESVLYKKHQIQIFYQKFQIYDLLEDYDRILYLDGDVLIHPSADNIFDKVPADRFGAYECHRERLFHHETDIYRIQKQFPDLGWQHRYFNSGVMVVSKVHREVFNVSHGIYTMGYGEQTQINYNLFKLKTPIYNIGKTYNSLDRAECFNFRHYASYEDRYNQIRRDKHKLYKVVTLL